MLNDTSINGKGCKYYFAKLLQKLIFSPRISGIMNHHHGFAPFRWKFNNSSFWSLEALKLFAFMLIGHMSGLCRGAFLEIWKGFKMEMGWAAACLLHHSKYFRSEERRKMRPGPQRRVEFSEAGPETKDLSEMRFRVSGFQRKQNPSILSTHLPGARRSFPRVLNNPIRDGLGRVIGRNFVSNIRCLRLHQ